MDLQAGNFLLNILAVIVPSAFAAGIYFGVVPRLEAQLIKLTDVVTHIAKSVTRLEALEERRSGRATER